MVENEENKVIVESTPVENIANVESIPVENTANIAPKISNVVENAAPAEQTTNSDHSKIKLCIFMIVILSIICATFLFSSLQKKDFKNVEVKSSPNIGYTINLNENSFYEANSLPENMEYIASLIKNIATNFTYTISSTDKLDYNGKYNIEAIINVYDDSTKTKTIFSRTIELVEDKDFKLYDTDTVSIFENLTIDYNAYNQLAAAFKTSYLLSNPSDVSIRLNVDADCYSKTLEKSVTIKESPELIIPLTEQTVNIELTKNTGNTYKVLDGEEKSIISNQSLFNIAILIAIVVIALIVYVIKKVFYSNDALKTYKRNLNRILRDYDMIIANVKELVDESTYEVIAVESFEELKDIRDNIGCPILYKELIKNKKSKFIIIKDNILYKYVLKCK